MIPIVEYISENYEVWLGKSAEELSGQVHILDTAWDSKTNASFWAL